MNHAIAFALLHSLWQGVSIAAVLWIVLRTIPSRLAPARYFISLAALSAMLLCFASSIAGVLSMPYNEAAAALPQPAIAWPAWIWMAGVTTLGCYRLAVWALLVRRIRQSTAPALDHWMDAMRVVQAKLRMSRRFTLLRADWLPSPAVYGVWKPVILIPAAAVAGLTPQQLEAVLAHELAHILRHDFLVNLLQTVAETILFYHPAAWWISKQIRQERECCCDQIATSFTGNPTVLAQALLALAEHRIATPMLAATHGNLRARIERLLDLQRPAPFSWPGAALLFTLLLAAHLFAFQDMPDHFARWLREDVLYIINNDERKAFLSLKTDQEREHFIGQFWTRRDPTPETEENEAKEEHYRRIAYSNELYGTNDAAGWRTDRGKMYIQVGPPDEINSWPVQALERWIYKTREGSPTATYEFQDGKLQAR